MDLNTFLDNFDTIAEAPGGIAKLRALILDLAVRGKLVPQDPEDESVDKLLVRIQSQKKAIVRTGTVPKTGELLSGNDAHEPFLIPSSWIWTRLGNISSYIQRGKSPKYTESGEVLVISQKCIQWAGFDITKAQFIQDETVPSYSLERFLQPGDLLWNSTGTGTVGRLSILPAVLKNKRIVADSHVTVIRIVECLPSFIYCWLASPHIQQFIDQKTSGTTKQKELNTITVRTEFIPLPPLPEQKRIVEKVDELMALCDRLAAAKQTRDDLRQKLRGSAIAALMNAETDDALEKSWVIVRDNWQTLSQDPKDVDDLRKIILRLAIRGKLAQREVNDEPAEKLLKVVADKQAAHPKKFRKPKDLSSIEDVEKPFELPFGWCWCRFTEIGQLERGKSKHRPRNEPALYANGSIPLVQTGDVARAKGVITTYTALYNEQGLAQSRLWSKGTLCITIAANIADSAMLGFDACFPDSVVGFVPTEPISDSRYFEFFIRTMKSTLEAFAPSTAQKNINLSILDEVLIPLPPLAEQKRIVAKVDELMQMCDQLEASLRQSQQRAEALAASAISHLTI